MTKFCFGSLINFFVILSTQYIGTFVLSLYYQLSDDVSPYKLIFPTLSRIVMVSRHRLTSYRNSTKVLIYQGLKTTKKILGT